MEKPLFDHEAFEQRERERADVRDVLNPILDSLRAAEERIERLGVVDDAQRHHLAGARHEILKVLHLQHRKAHTRSEILMRSTADFVGRVE